MSERREWTRERLVEGLRAGDRRALARAITLVENGDPLADGVVADLYPETGRTYAVGLTGSPGAGKSSLVSALVGHVRAAEDAQVGVVSVDPSSPFTEGAVLGDRIRLADHFLDPAVFIRSMGTRGHPGGLAEATLQALLLLDAAGKDVVFLETVGTGQSEIGVAQVADTVVLVLMPGSGDAIQAMKAGIMEIPDAIAVNKADQPHAKAMLSDVRRAVELGADGDRRPPVVLTDALSGQGVPELWAAVREHRAWLEADGRLEERRRRRLGAEVLRLAGLGAQRRVEEMVRRMPELRRLLADVEERQADPLGAVRAILGTVFPLGDDDRTDSR